MERRVRRLPDHSIFSTRQNWRRLSATGGRLRKGSSGWAALAFASTGQPIPAVPGAQALPDVAARGSTASPDYCSSRRWTVLRLVSSCCRTFSSRAGARPLRSGGRQDLRGVSDGRAGRWRQWSEHTWSGSAGSWSVQSPTVRPPTARPWPAPVNGEVGVARLPRSWLQARKKAVGLLHVEKKPFVPCGW